MPPKKQTRTKAVTGPRQTKLDLKSIKPTSTEVEYNPYASNLTALSWLCTQNSLLEQATS